MAKQKIVLGEKQLKVVQRPFKHNLEVLEGTPRSGKTTAAHFRYARYLVETNDTSHMIVAYNQEQAYRLMIDGDGTGLMHIFGNLAETKHDEHGSHLEIHTPKGIRKVYYKGGGKSNSVGAITGMSLGSVVFCEINLLHMSMIQECFRRTFAAIDRFHMADLNPPAPSHPVIKEVFEVQDTLWQHWTPQDNPILSDQRKEDIRTTLEKNPYLYKRDWLGQRVMPEGLIYSVFDMDENKWEMIQGKPVEMFFSADGGQSDATSCSCNIVVLHEGKYKLLRVANYYHSGSDTGQTYAMSIYAKKIKEFMEWCYNKFELRHSNVFVDPACKSLREELHLLGVMTRGADNNASDKLGNAVGMEVGIERMQSLMTDKQFLIVEADEYDHYHFLREIGLYVRNDNGKPIDDYNHALDELRYSGNYFYKRYVKGIGRG